MLLVDEPPLKDGAAPCLKAEQHDVGNPRLRLCAGRIARPALARRDCCAQNTATAYPRLREHLVNFS
jgi:hypothetical protein